MEPTHAAARYPATDEQALRLIVNADDLGFTRPINEATFEMMARGKVTSATLMASGPVLEEAVERLGEFRGCSFGAHLCLTELRPLTDSPHLAFLRGPDGDFVDRRGALCRWSNVWRPGVPAALYHELCAQVGRLLDLGVRPTHLDSHHHVHAIPALLPIFKWVQATFGIRRIRPRLNLFDGRIYRAGALERRKRALQNLALRRLYRSATPDGFTSLGSFVAGLDVQVPHGSVVELMVHPGHPSCVAETALLATDWLDRLPYPARLISYHDLPTGR